MKLPPALKNLLAAGALAALLATSARANVVLVQYLARNGAGGFPENGGPHWTGEVDTVANTLTIITWTDLPGTPEFWSPVLGSLPMVWPAVTAAGTPYDVPDNFMGHIDASFAFISPVSAQNMLWNQGRWGQSPTFQYPPEIDFFPGWGGLRKPVNVNGVAVMSYDTTADETQMPRLPLTALAFTASTGATVSAAPAPVIEGGAVPEASSFLFAAAAVGAGASLIASGRIAKTRAGRLSE